MMWSCRPVSAHTNRSTASGTSYFLTPQMVENVRGARIIITHGGPASFIMPLQEGKIPIVVPRQLQFNEHVNDHKVEFARAVAERMGNIIPVYDIKDLAQAIADYDGKVGRMANSGLNSNNQQFNQQLERISSELFAGKGSVKCRMSGSCPCSGSPTTVRSCKRMR